MLRGFGLPDDRTVDAIRTARSALHGFVVLEAGGGFGMPDSVDRSFEALLDTVVAGIRARWPAPDVRSAFIDTAASRGVASKG